MSIQPAQVCISPNLKPVRHCLYISLSVQWVTQKKKLLQLGPPNGCLGQTEMQQINLCDLMLGSLESTGISITSHLNKALKAALMELSQPSGAPAAEEASRVTIWGTGYEQMV